MVKFEKIYCPVDFSEPSYEALERASDLAEHFGGKLRVVHVIQQYPAYATAAHAGVGFSVEEYKESMTEKSRESMKKAVSEHVSDRVEAEHEILYGDPAKEVLRDAKEWGTEMLVISSHGWTVLEEIFFGSVAEKILRHSRMPVLVVPRKNGE